MRSQDVRQALGILGFVLASLGTASTSMASPLAINETFTTTGEVGTTGITGTPAVSFQGISDGTLTTGSTFSLGQFVVTPPAEGSTTYNSTPFTIDFHANSVGGAVPSPNQIGELPGILNGTVAASGESSLTAYLGDLLSVLGTNQTALVPVVFRTGDYINGLTPSQESLSLAIQGTGGGVVGVNGVLGAASIATVPEPGSLAVFLCCAVACASSMKRARRV